MKRVLTLTTIILTLALVCPVLAQGPPSGAPSEAPAASPPAPPPGSPAGPPPGAGGRRGPGPAGLQLNPKDLATVKGVVEASETPKGLSWRSRRQMAMHHSVSLRTDKGAITVYLGPTWYLEKQKFSPQAGERLEVNGWKITRNNQTMIVAKEIKSGGKTLQLRDDQGIPAWRRMGMGPK